MSAIHRVLGFALVCLMSALPPAGVQAQSSAPSFAKAFAPTTIGPGSVSTLTFTIGNSAASAVQNLAFTDTLPAGMTIADGTAATNCTDGVLVAPTSGGTITFSGARLAAGQTCTVTVDVTASAPGPYANTSGDLTSSAGNSGPATANLTVNTNTPGFSKSFAPSSIPLGGTSTLTLTIDNSANSGLVSSLGFTDTLPAGLVVATPANTSTTCTGTLTTAAGSSSIALSSAFLMAGTSCQVSVDVAGSTLGAHANSVDLSGVPSGSFSFVPMGKATDTLTVTGAPAGTLQITKDFTDDPVGPGGTTTLQFSITNLDRSNPATAVAFDDVLTSMLPGLSASSAAPASDPCGAGSALALGGTVSLSGGTLAGGETCTFSVTVDVPATAPASTYTNTTSAVTGTIDGNAVTGNMASNKLTVLAASPLTFTKEFVPDSVVAGGDVVVRYTIANPNTGAGTDATAIAFNDVMSDTSGAFPAPAFDNGFLPTPVSAVIPPGGSACGGSVFFSDGLFLTGGTLAPGANCTFDVTLTIPVGLAGGTYTDRTDVLTASVLSTTVTSAPAADDLTVSGGVSLSFAKSFSAPAAPGDTVDLTFVISNPPESLAVTDIAFTDDLAATLAGLSAGAPSVNTCGGSMTGTSLLSYSGGTLAADASCAITVPVTVPVSAASGTFTNTTSNLTATGASLSLTFPPASADLTVAGLTFTKSFAPSSVIAGLTTTLTYTIRNTHPTDDATITFFRDNLADILPGAPDVTLSSGGADTCGGVFLSTSPGATLMDYSGGGVLAGQTCTIAIGVLVPVGAPDGSFRSATGNLSADQNGAVTIDPAVASLTVDSVQLGLAKSFADDSVAPGDTVTLEFTLTNLSATEPAGAIAFGDDLGAMLPGATMASADFAACGGTVAGQGSNQITFTGGSLAASADCTIAVDVAIPGGAAAGLYTNTTSAVTGDMAGVSVTGDPASDDLLVTTVGTLFSKSFAGPSAAGQTATLTFTITNPNATPVTGLGFTDDLDAMLGGAVAASLPSSPCGAGSSITGTSVLTFSGGEVAGAGGTCSFDVDVTVPASAAAGSYPNETSALTSSGVFSARKATASLQVEPPPSFSKTFAPATIAVGQQSTLTFTIDNSASVLATSALDFTDNLPSGMQVAATPGAATTCTGGTLTAVAGSGTVAYTGGSLAAGATCTVAVDVIATATGTHVNTTGDLTSSTGNSGTATDTLRADPLPLFSKAFAAPVISLGTSTTLIFTIDNSGAVLDALALDLSDTFPAGLQVASVPNVSTTCTGGTITAVAGDTDVAYSGGSVAGGATCTLSVDVTPSAVGALNNLSNALTSSLGNSGTAAATLTVITPEIGVSGDIGGAVAAGGTLPQGNQPATFQQTLTLTVTNTGTETLTLVDPVVSNLVNVTVDNTPSLLALSVTPGNSTTVEVQYTATSAGAFSFDLSIGNNDVDEAPYDITVSGTGVDVTAPAGYTVSFDQDPVNAAGQTAVSFTFAGAEIGARYDYQIGSSGGGPRVNGTGTIATATDQITGIDVSGLADGTLTLTATLTDAALNTGLDATDTAAKDTVAPAGYTVAYDQDPINIANLASSTFTVTGAEVGTTLEYSLSSNGVTFSGFSEPVTTATQTVGAPLPLGGLSDGPVTLRVTLTDAAGNTGTEVSDIATKDLVAPSLAFDAPLAGDDVVNAAEASAVTISGTSTDLPDGSTVTVVVSDGAAGSVILTPSVTGGVFSVSADLSGLADGALTLTADATDPAGNPAPQASATATKDTVAPAGYTVAYDQDPINIANLASATFTVTGAEVGTLLEYSLSSNGVTFSGFSEPVTTATQPVGAPLPLGGLSDGPVTLRVTLTDAAGNTGTEVSDIATKDLVAPSLAFDAPLAGDDVVNAAEASAVTISGTSTDLPDGSTVTVVVSDGAAGSVILTPSVTGGVFSVSADLSGLADGALTLTADATDPAGNPAPQASATATKDTVAPSGYTVAFDQDPVNAANQTAMSISFAGAEVGTGFAYTITSDGGGTPVTGTGTIATGTDTVSGLDLSGLGDGTLTVTAALTDAAGNTGADASDTATKDATAPGAGFDTPIAGDGTVNAAEAPAVTVSGTASGVLDGAIVTVAASDGALSVSGPATVTAGAWSLTLDLTALAEGPLSLTADVADAAGNPAPQATASAAKDTVAPTLAIDTPIAGDDIVNAAEAPAVTLTGTATGLTDGATVNVNVWHNAGASVVINSTTVTGGVWSVTSNLSAVVDGPITVIANASDAAGNPATPATALAAKEGTAPSGYAASFDQDPVNSGNQTAASFTFAGAEVGTTYAFTVTSDGGGTPVTGSGTIATPTDQVTGLDLSGLTDGTLTLTVALTDAAGNTGADAIDTAAKDTLAPAGYAVSFDQDPVNLANVTAVSFTFAGAEPGASYAFTVTSDGGGTPVTGTGTLATATDQVTGLDLSGLSDGTLTLTVALTDPAGNTGADVTDTTTKDATAPAGYTASLDQDPVNAGNVAAVSFTFAGAEPGTSYAFAITSDAGGTPVTGTGTIVTPTDQLTGLDLSGLTDGTLTLTVALTDPAGNTGADATDTATLDATLPTVTFDTPIAGDDLVNAAEAPAATLSGTSTDLPDGTPVTVVVSDGAAGSVTLTPSVTGGLWTVSANLSALADGPLSLTADASDPAGNAAVQATASAVKDTVAPTGYAATLDQDPVNSLTQAAASFTFAGAEPGASYAFTVTSDGGGTPVTGTGTLASATDTVSGLDLSGLSDGTLTLTVALTDPAGNTGADATDTAAKDALAPTATLTGPLTAQSGAFTVGLTFSEPVIGLNLASVDIDNGSASALTGSGAVYSFTVTPDHDGPIEITLLAGAAADAAGNLSAAAGPLLAVAHLTGVPNPVPLPDADGDGIPDDLESAFADRDGDGIPDASDFDPQGYFYCEDDGRIIPGGSFSVSGPLGTNSSLGIANGINITHDGSTGEMQWFALVPGTFTMAITYPTSVGLPSTARLPSGTLDMTTLLPANPAFLGSSEFGASGFLADASLAANPVFYTSFTIEPGDPFVLSNNIPMTQCATNAVNLTASTDGAEANGGVPTDVTFTVTQDRVSTQDTVVSLALTGSATAGADYTAPAATVTIPAGATSATVTLPVLEDVLVEGPETVTATLTAIASGDLSTELGTTLSASATITDDDFAVIAVTNVDLVTSEGGGDDASMSFVLLGGPSAPVTLNFAGDSQCSVSPASMTFTTANFGTPQTLTIRAKDDDKVEGTHTCQPTVTVASADLSYDGYPLTLATVTVTDDLVDQIREPLTQILEEDLKDTIDTQQRNFSRMAKGALARLQEGQDLPCGTLSAFDVDGSLEIKDATGTAAGTFGRDTYNCATDTREIVDGSFTLNKTEDTGLQALLQFAFQREKFISDSEIAGYFVGGYFSRTDVSGLGDGDITGFGVNGGFYGARGISDGLFLDYYLAGAAGRHRFDIDFAAAAAPINARGSYGYLAGFAGVGISGQHAFDSFVMKPRVALDLAYALAGDADVTARQLGLTHTGVIKLDDFSGMRATAEITFESLAAPGGSEALATRMRTAITPRLTCTLNSYDSDAECGVGLTLAWEKTNSASGLTFGFEIDAERIEDDSSLTFNIKRERPILNGAGAVVTRLSMPQAQTWQVEHGVQVDF
ncbi:DUF7933 domain-containing protein [Maliponia aquimaris]|uniref:Calx-beta domain protein n=1 Tax=Maliponia aquimaris TaxID=1673631 RepID=A0A238KD35_9RHOB|nr:hypothetical protein [Maliponia aquimaris]SMX40768.1 Calx-beta domain protein [Maliponia aquimaris]